MNSASTVTVLVFAAVTSAAAQTPDNLDVAVSIQGGASWHPVDDTYVGAPYLDKGLGGLGPALVLGVDVWLRRLGFAFEYSFARIDVMQTGRLVSGTAEGQLHDHLFSFLAGGAAWSTPAASVGVLAGVTVLPSQPRQNGTPIDASNDPAAFEGRGRVGLTVGADYSKRLKDRLDVVATGRYSLLPRSRRAEELGVGLQMFRFGAGVRIRLTR